MFQHYLTMGRDISGFISLSSHVRSHSLFPKKFHYSILRNLSNFKQFAGYARLIMFRVVPLGKVRADSKHTRFTNVEQIL